MKRLGVTEEDYARWCADDQFIVRMKAYFNSIFSARAPQIIDKLISKATNGDIHAMNRFFELWEKFMGQVAVAQNINITNNFINMVEADEDLDAEAKRILGEQNRIEPFIDQPNEDEGADV